MLPATPSRIEWFRLGIFLYIRLDVYRATLPRSRSVSLLCHPMGATIKKRFFHILFNIIETNRNGKKKSKKFEEKKQKVLLFGMKSVIL